MSKKLVLPLLAVAFSFLLSGCGGGKFTDSRDGKTYNTVRMPDGKMWMAENLNFQTTNSWCYGGSNSNCDKYGRLYTWNAAMSACPAGWRLPTRQDWNGLVAASGGNHAGTRLKASQPDWNGSDDYGFSALPGGGRYTDGNFSGVGGGGGWWMATEGGSGAYFRYMSSGLEYVGEDTDGKGYGYSVGCLQD